MTIYFVAQVWRGRIRRQSLRFFTDGKKAVELYQKYGLGGVIWKSVLDKDSPPKALLVAEIRELSGKK